MTEPTRKSSFSAYSGATDVPLDFAPMRAVVRGGSIGGATLENLDKCVDQQWSLGLRLRVWVLLAMLVAAGAFALTQYQSLIVDTFQSVSAKVPQLNTPQITRPVINRAINTVRMESPLHRVTEQEVRTLLARYTESGFLGVNVQDLRNELEQNPWVAQAMVRRVWPDVLVIRIQEQVPVARWGASSLLNSDGNVFTPPMRGNETALPSLSGPVGSEAAVIARFEQFSEVVAQIAGSIASLSLSERGSWELALQDGPLLRIGRDNVDSRLERFVAAYRKGLQDHLADASTIDLRYSNGFSVSKTPKGSESLARR